MRRLQQSNVTHVNNTLSLPHMRISHKVYLLMLRNKVHITKTCLYSFDPLKPHLYLIKVGFTGVYIIFLISAQNIDCGYSLELSRDSKRVRIIHGKRAIRVRVIELLLYRAKIIIIKYYYKSRKFILIFIFVSLNLRYI